MRRLHIWPAVLSVLCAAALLFAAVAVFSVAWTVFG